MAPGPESMLAKRWGLASGTRLALVSAPDGFARSLVVPDGVRVRTSARGRVDVLVFFATRRAELARRLPAMVRALDHDGSLWVAWPKRTSGVASDLGQSAVHDLGVAVGLTPSPAYPVDGQWSGIRFRVRDRIRAVS